MMDVYGRQDITADKTLMIKIMRFFVTLIFLILEIIRYGCEWTLTQLPIMAEMTNSTGVGKNIKSQQERYIRQTIPPLDSKKKRQQKEFRYQYSRQILCKRITSKTRLNRHAASFLPA